VSSQLEQAERREMQVFSIGCGQAKTLCGLLFFYGSAARNLPVGITRLYLKEIILAFQVDLKEVKDSKPLSETPQ